MLEVVKPIMFLDRFDAALKHSVRLWVKGCGVILLSLGVAKPPVLDGTIRHGPGHCVAIAVLGRARGNW
jgi:hypothetical protein